MKLRRRAQRVRVPGFRFAGVRAGIKTRGLDLALIVADSPAVVAGMFTTNRTTAAPLQISRERVRAGRASAVLVNAGNANACTGAQGRRTVKDSTALAATLLGVAPASVLACSTGRIGVQLPRPKLLAGVRAAVRALDAGQLPAAAQAIMTSDAFPKTAVRRIAMGGRTVTVAAVGKGAGMIAPNMATLLVFVLTDATVGVPAARRALAFGVEGTLNAITVDGDMSTNDTVLLLASGAADAPSITSGSRAHARFTRAVAEVLGEIATMIVLDGEGSTRVIELTIRGARTDAEARRVARAVGESTLCKAAFHGGDPNWGRFICAAGTAGVPLDQDRVDVTIGGVAVARRGLVLPGRVLERARAHMRRRQVALELHLHGGRGTARILTSDLTTQYVHFNAAYTT
jgi:glutamate N-acetyltransferase/amino-acid N-acetyltransferase